MIFDCGLLDLYDQYIAADSPDLGSIRENDC